MGGYLDIIKESIFAFPLIALLFTLPYIIYNYNKYGSLWSVRIVIIYSFILYLMTAYFLVILPLPSFSEVASLTTRSAQLVPFNFIKDIISQYHNMSLSYNSPITCIVNNRAFLQVLFNLLMTVPFGMYLRYYFKFSLKKTILFSFLLSLFFELTQLSGLYFFYPRSYRLFDVDDLFINTLGGVIGYFVIKPFYKVLPDREEMDDESYKRGIKVSFLRKLIAFIIDMPFIWGLYYIVRHINIDYGIDDYYIFSLSVFMYFFVLCVFLKGRSIGKALMKLRIVAVGKEDIRIYQYFIRYFSLFFVLLLLPYEINEILNNWFINTDAFVFLNAILSGVYFFYFFFACIMIIIRRPLFYEKLSKSEIISTIKREEQDE
ncbi:VanZ family protein [Anaerofustis sp. NSJ-163]|uniref:VanZ family protein n=1 Tax=Anaerofustis sp. NSJ-163 TaxID=2944391 RepID=UPI00209C4BA4|nr:VanZ family protein [Anaerofustis sp. NSJ-163]MCO8193069.1 VanZ family protein [Anaerofustis sp. NSJ-163]